MKRTNKSEQGFSLVEIAIVLVIIGLIVASVAAGRNAMDEAGLTRMYKRSIVPCVSAAMLNRPVATIDNCAVDADDATNRTVVITAVDNAEAVALQALTIARLPTDDYTVGAVAGTELTFNIVVNRPR